MDEQKQKFISWEAPEYEYHEKGTGWYLILGIFSFGFLALAYIFNNFLFGVLVILMAFTVAIFASKKPTITIFNTIPQGILIGKRLYPYTNIKSFWIYYDPPARKEISIVLKGSIIPRVSLPIADTDPNEIHEVLMQFIKEEPHGESIPEAIARYLRF